MVQEQTGTRCVKLQGSMSLEARGKIIDQFSTDHETNVFLMSLKAGGVALNLTAATHVCLMDPWWCAPDLCRRPLGHSPEFISSPRRPH
jgi:hypothetical protein